MKPTCPYDFPHRSRKARVDYICGIGGYSSRDGRWPIEFNVATYHVDFDFDHIWKEYSKEHIPSECKGDPALMNAYHQLAKRLHKENVDYFWEWGLEDARRDLDEREGDTFFQLWDGTPVEVKLELHGRGGKHLVIAEWDGRDLSKLNPEDLHDEMLAQVNAAGNFIVDEGRLRSRYLWESWTSEQVELLYRYVRQCETDFTPKNASNQVECEGAFCFFANIVAAEWETLRKEIATHEEVVGAAQAIHLALTHAAVSQEEIASFYVLCAAAGVTQEEAQS